MVKQHKFNVDNMSKLDGRLTTSEKQIYGQATEISNLQSDVLKQKGEYTDLI